MPLIGDKPNYQTLALPNEVLANGGVEILRAGVADDELYVTARHAFKDPAQWGEVLADITRRLGLLYSMETDLSEAEAVAEIEEAYAAELGAPVVKETPSRRKPATRRPVKRKSALRKPKSRTPKRSAPTRSKRVKRTKR